MTNNKNLKDLIDTIKAPDYWRPSLSRYRNSANQSDTKFMRGITDRYSSQPGMRGIIATEGLVLGRQKGVCFYTGEELYNNETGEYKGSIDHIIPASRGGIICPENVVMTTFTINSNRSDKNIETFIDELYESGKLRNDKTPEELKSELRELENLYKENYPLLHEFYLNTENRVATTTELARAFPDITINNVSNSCYMNSNHPDSQFWKEFTEAINEKYSSSTGLKKNLGLIGSLWSDYSSKSMNEATTEELDEFHQDLFVESYLTIIEPIKDKSKPIEDRVKSTIFSAKEFFLHLNRVDLLLKTLKYYKENITGDKSLKNYLSEICFGSENNDYNKFNELLLTEQILKEKPVSDFDENEVEQLYNELKDIQAETSSISFATLERFISLLPQNVKDKSYLLNTNRKLIEQVGISDEVYQNYLNNYRERVDDVNQSDTASSIIKEEDILYMMKYKESPVEDYIDYLYNKVVEDYKLQELSFEKMDSIAKNIKIFNNKNNFIKILDIIFDNKSENEMNYLYLLLDDLTPVNIIRQIKKEKLKARF